MMGTKIRSFSPLPHDLSLPRTRSADIARPRRGVFNTLRGNEKFASSGFYGLCP